MVRCRLIWATQSASQEMLAGGAGRARARLGRPGGPRGPGGARAGKGRVRWGLEGSGAFGEGLLWGPVGSGGSGRGVGDPRLRGGECRPCVQCVCVCGEFFLFWFHFRVWTAHVGSPLREFFLLLCGQ